MSDFTLPDLGEGIHEAEIISIKVKEGDRVEEDQPLFEVETDKAVVEIPSPYAGIVTKIHVKEGTVVKVGINMISFDVSGGAKAAPAKAEKEDKATASAPAAKTEAKENSNEAQKVPASVGAKTGTADSARTASGGNGNSGKPAHDPSRPVPAAPAVRRLARELGVDLYTVHGSGAAGRVMKEDVRASAQGTLSRMASSVGSETKEKSAPQLEMPKISLQDKYGGGGSGTAFDATPMTAQPVELPDFDRFGKTERVPLRSIRRKIAQNMTLSWTHIPHVTHFDEANVTDLSNLLGKRDKNKSIQGPRLTMTAFAIKAVASALQKYPQFNSSLDEAKGEIVFKQFYNIGVAVATERGLIVPVIHNADQKTIKEIASELGDIAEKTRSGKVELEKLQGGTFTITNIGAIGGTSMVPMVNYPECGILGMARAAEKPIVEDGQIKIATILPLALSFDHRLADGAEAAYFVRHIISLLQEPFSLLID
jgi:pyruvate dehydrogenase E2 component (dihydrolipoamide acetyltransferase)